ncbi:MAG: hypothetical protein QG602_3796 [Verrucomicrobiota bacterium]|nr:hypothetical protein [Verrucomicrobiota bacterium]
MNPNACRVTVIMIVLAGAVIGSAAETVATAVYSRVSKGYKREKAKDGSFLPEYYAMTNGGRIDGTSSDITVDRVTYAEVAEITRQLLGNQNYHLAQSKEQAKLLLVLNWGSTIAPNGMHQQQNIASLRSAMASLGMDQHRLNNPASSDEGAARPVYEGQDLAGNATKGFNRSPQWATNEEMAVVNAANSVESSFVQSLSDDRVRDRLNEANARVLGYLDDLADANDIRRYAGGGDRYNDLIGDVEESRYYIVVSAYDLHELEKKNKKKLLWQTRVSVRSPGNSFNETYLAMLKNASQYFGLNSGKLVRGEGTKGTVELGELKFLGEAKESAETEGTEEEASKEEATDEETTAAEKEEGK